MNEQYGSQKVLVSIIDKLHKSNGRSTIRGLKAEELAMGMQLLSDENNTGSLLNLLDEYSKWRLNCRENETDEQIREEVLTNLDFIAQLADNLAKSRGSKHQAEIDAIYGDQNKIGPVRQFFRKTIGYEPPAENLPSQSNSFN